MEGGSEGSMRGEVVMPALSPAMTDGKIAKWHVAEGQTVLAGDIIAEIETGTATAEIEAKDEGRVERILVPAGTAGVRVNTPIAVIRTEPSAAEARATLPVALMSAPTAPAPRIPLAADDTSELQTLTYREALRDALAEEMRRDASVVLFGVDLAQNRGAPKVSQGLLDDFGPRRVVTTPALEDAATGLAVGAALAGLRPVVEFRSWAVALEAVHYILATVPEIASLSGSAMAVPIVFRGRNGWAPGAAGSDGRCYASLFAQVPGLKVVMPATPADAKGLLKAAIRDPSPVVVLEHEMLYGETGPVPASDDFVVPIGVARRLVPGRDLTIVAYGRAVSAALAAAAKLATAGIEAEVIDLVSVRPLDVATVAASVARTGRLMVVEEGWPECSIGSEVVAAVAERAFDRLAAAPVRLAGRPASIPYAPALAEAAIPGTDSIISAVRALLGQN